MGEMALREALDEYKNVYMAYRNFADRTRVEYQNDLEGFIGFLNKSGIQHIKEIGVPIIERYIANLEQKGFASLTRKRKVVAIRSFLLFLYQDGYIMFSHKQNAIRYEMLVPTVPEREQLSNYFFKQESSFPSLYI